MAFSDPASGVRQRHSHRSLWVTAASLRSAQIQGGRGGHRDPTSQWEECGGICRQIQSTVALNTFAGWMEANFLPTYSAPGVPPSSLPAPLSFASMTPACLRTGGQSSLAAKVLQANDPPLPASTAGSSALLGRSAGHWATRSLSEALPAVALGSPFPLAFCEGTGGGVQLPPTGRPPLPVSGFVS